MTNGRVDVMNQSALRRATRSLAVELSDSSDPLVARVFAVLRDRVERRCPVAIVQGSDAPRVILAVDRELPGDTFRIDARGDAVRVSGGSPRGLLYGVGKFLRTSSY